MATVTIEAGKLGMRIRQDQAGAPKAVERAIFSAMHRGRSYIVGKTPVDRGILRVAWKVMKLVGGGAELVNDAPYAGIMEWKTARAHQKASKKTGNGIKKAQLWALDDEAKSIAYAIAKHFEKVGMKGKRFVYMAMPELTKLMEEEINRSLEKFFNRP